MISEDSPVKSLGSIGDVDGESLRKRKKPTLKQKSEERKPSIKLKRAVFDPDKVLSSKWDFFNKLNLKDEKAKIGIQNGEIDSPF